jgi:plasmid stability protein
MINMFFHMKTTLNIDDQIMKQLKSEAAKQGKTISFLVESALRAALSKKNTKLDNRLPELPSFDGGGAKVTIADRDELYRIMEGQ